VSKRAIITLTTGFEPTPANIELMERAINVLIARKMTEKKAKKLAEWIKAGNAPETFGEMGKKTGVSDSAGALSLQGQGKTDPLEQDWQGLPGNIISVKQAKDGTYDILIKKQNAGNALVAAYGAMAAVEGLKLKQRPPEAGKGNIFGEQLPSIYDRALGIAQEAQGGDGVSGKGDEEQRVGTTEAQRIGRAEEWQRREKRRDGRPKRWRVGKGRGRSFELWECQIQNGFY